MYNTFYYIPNSDTLIHYGVKGQKWGERHYQNKDGTWTAEGKARRNAAKSKESLHKANTAIKRYAYGNTQDTVFRGDIQRTGIASKVSKYTRQTDPNGVWTNLKNSYKKIAVGAAFGAAVGGVGLSTVAALPVAIGTGAWVGLVASIPLSKVWKNEQKFDNAVDNNIRNIVKNVSKTNKPFDHNTVSNDIIRSRYQQEFSSYY